MGAIEAIYEAGVFRPLAPVALPEHSRVRFSLEVVTAEPPQNLDAIYAAMDMRFNSGEPEVAARHSEHQP